MPRAERVRLHNVGDTRIPQASTSGARNYRWRKQVELGITNGEKGESNDVVAIYGRYRFLRVYSWLYKP
jgi:hypothetical protein